MSGLDRLVGEWALTMRHSQVAEPVLGRHRYGWVLDGAFLRMDSTYERADFPDALMLLTPERHHYFDVRGVVRVFEVDGDGDGWTATYLDDEFSQRSTARFADDDTVETSGERSADRGATWQSDFATTLRRLPR